MQSLPKPELPLCTRDQGSHFLRASIALTPLAFHPTNIVPMWFFATNFSFLSSTLRLVGFCGKLPLPEGTVCIKKNYKAEVFKLPFVVGVGGLDTAQKRFSRWLHTAGQTHLKLSAIMLYDIILMDKS